jgi:hypothetical protein
VLPLRPEDLRLRRPDSRWLRERLGRRTDSRPAEYQLPPGLRDRSCCRASRRSSSTQAAGNLGILVFGHRRDRPSTCRACSRSGAADLVLPASPSLAQSLYLSRYVRRLLFIALRSACSRSCVVPAAPRTASRSARATATLGSCLEHRDARLRASRSCPRHHDARSAWSRAARSPRSCSRLVFMPGQLRHPQGLGQPRAVAGEHQNVAALVGTRRRPGGRRPSAATLRASRGGAARLGLRARAAHHARCRARRPARRPRASPTRARAQGLRSLALAPFFRDEAEHVIVSRLSRGARAARRASRREPRPSSGRRDAAASSRAVDTAGPETEFTLERRAGRCAARTWR